MYIQWFPGHMTKSIRLMQQSLSGIDFVIYVVDSRAPQSCLNPVFDELFGDLPIVYVLNKADLGDVNLSRKWCDLHTTTNSVAIQVNSLASTQINVLATVINKLCKVRLDKYASRGIRISLRGMVVGVPNVGKSTLINNIARAKKTKTGDTPGVTRGKQWIKVDQYLDILDTPGTLYPKLNDQNVAVNLAIVGSISSQVVDMYELSLQLIDKLQAISPNILDNKYQCTTDMDGVRVLHQVAVKRAFVLKGGELDIERAAVALIQDFRQGRLGKITLDRF
ncbi:MAG: ribosome biogenesis GTPase YlqF [Clostridiales bacterium]|nr:ribosome biogenesis GTPase YlqF [Clostridiales bacterium]